MEVHILMYIHKYMNEEAHGSSHKIFFRNLTFAMPPYTITRTYDSFPTQLSRAVLSIRVYSSPDSR